MTTPQLDETLLQSLIEGPKPKEKSNTSDSYLTDFQREGQARRANPDPDSDYKSLDQALADVCKIGDRDVIAELKATPVEDWATSPLKTYCFDCGAIVPAAIGQTARGNPRVICGLCHSRKIASGTAEALKKFYHIKDEAQAKADENAKDPCSVPKFQAPPPRSKKRRRRSDKRRRSGRPRAQKSSTEKS